MSTETVGGGGDYADLKTAIDSVGAIGSETIEFIVQGANSPGADIDFDKVSNADGLLYVHSTVYGFRGNPLTTSSAKWWRMDGRCNITMEHLNIKGSEFHYESATTGSTGRTHTIRCCVLEKSNTTIGTFAPGIDNPGTPLSIEFYGNFIFSTVGSASAGETFVFITGWTSAIWNANIFIENNTFVYDNSYSAAAIVLSGALVSPIFHNNVVYQTGSTNAWLEGVGTPVLNNCARNKALSGTFTENNCITDLAATDFVSVVTTNNDCGKIIPSSRLYGAGLTSSNIPGYTRDIIGAYVNPEAPSMGAFQAYTVPDSEIPSRKVYGGHYVAQFMFRYRLDLGAWSPWVNYNLGAKGENDPWLTKLGLGIGREIEIEISATDGTDFIMTDMDLTIRELSN